MTKVEATYTDESGITWYSEGLLNAREVNLMAEIRHLEIYRDELLARWQKAQERIAELEM